jgi:hypothetical protein
MKKKFIISGFIIFITSLLYNGLVHGVLLKNSYVSIRHLLREDMGQKMWLSLLTTLAISYLFVFNFSKWSKGKGIKEGILYGIFFACLIGLFVDINQYVMYPLPFIVVTKWFISGLLEFVIDGIIVSFIYSKNAES